MSTNFPTSLDTFINPTATDEVSVVSHSGQHTNINDAVTALEVKVGINGSAVQSTIDYKLSEVVSGDKAVGIVASQTLENKTISGNDNTLTDIDLTASVTGILPTTNGGLGVALVDPNADRLLGWNNTSNEHKYITPGSGLSLVGDVLTVSSPAITLTMTAQEDLTAGMPVGASSYLNSQVARSRRLKTDTVTGITGTGDVGRYRMRCAIGGNKFAYLNYTSASSDTLFVQVGEYQDDNTIDVGTAESVATSFTPGTQGNELYTIAKLDTDKFIVLYLKDSSAVQLYYRVGTVSGTTITLGTEAVLTTASSTIATSNTIHADFIDTDKVAIIYKCATVADSRVLVATASGTVATAGTPVALGTNTRTNTLSAVRKIATDKFVVVCQNANDSVYAQAGTISGSTITLGSEAQISTTTSLIEILQFDVVSHDTDAFTVIYQRSTVPIGGAFLLNALVCTVSTTTITAGTPLTTIATASGASCTVVALNTTELIITMMTNTGQEKNAVKYTISGTTITSSGVTLQRFSEQRAYTSLKLDSGEFLFFLFGDTMSTSVLGMSNNFMGIAQNTALKGASVSVLLAGVDTNQTGLTPGAYYLINNGAYSIISDQQTVNTLDDMSVVVAISPTSIKF